MGQIIPQLEREMRDIQMKRSPQIQAALDAASSAVGDLPERTLVRLGLKALALFATDFRERSPLWFRETLPDAKPRTTHLHVWATDETSHLLVRATAAFLGQPGLDELIDITQVVRLGLLALALFGRQLDEEQPGWREREVE